MSSSLRASVDERSGGICACCMEGPVVKQVNVQAGRRRGLRRRNSRAMQTDRQSRLQTRCLRMRVAYSLRLSEPLERCYRNKVDSEELIK